MKKQQKYFMNSIRNSSPIQNPVLLVHFHAETKCIDLLLLMIVYAARDGATFLRANQ
jgi:hypothetical protein